MRGNLTDTRYTGIAIALHWSIAVLIVWQIVTGLWMVPAIDDPDRFVRAFSVYQWHKSTGLTVLVLSIVRVFWRLAHVPPPLPAATSSWRVTASRLVHALLYLMMVAVPIAGWLVASSSSLGLPTLVYGLFEWPHLPVSPTFEPVAKSAHRWLAYALAALALAHAVAAMSHHVNGDGGVLRRMWPGK